MAGPHEVVFEHRRGETKGCLQARQGGVKSNFIGSNHAVG